MRGVITDRFDRPLRSLRISVTDRCNLRCQYCMPEPDYAWLPRQSILDFEEIAVLVDAEAGERVDQHRDFLEVEDALPGEPRVIGFRHAVLAAQVAAVGHRNAQAAQRAIEAVCDHSSHYR